MGERRGGFVALLRGRTARSRAVASTIVLATLAAGIATPALADDAVSFTDPDLAACVRDALGLGSGAEISTTALAELDELSCGVAVNIGSLVGLEHALNLEYLDLFGSLGNAKGDMTGDERNAATEAMLSPLAGLSKLEYLDVSYNYPSVPYDVGVLSALPSLSELWVSKLKGGDLTPIAEMPHLAVLGIDIGTNISDVAPLADATELARVQIYDLDADDLGPFAEMPALTSLHLPWAHASELPSFAGHTQLQEVSVYDSSVRELGSFAGSGLVVLDVSSSYVTNLDAIADAEHLEEVYLDGSEVSSLEPLADNTSLTFLSAAYAMISDLSPLAGKTNLTAVDVDGNAILDISWLSHLPALEYWTALDQYVELPDTISCVPTELPSAIDFDGSALALTPNSGRVNGRQVVLTYDGYSWVRATSATTDFEVTLATSVTGYTGDCPWPEGWLPTVTFPSALDEGRPVSVTVAGGSYPTPRHDTSWTRQDGSGLASWGDTFTPADFTAGDTRKVAVKFSATGMQTATITGPTLTTLGHFPESAAIDFDNPLEARYDASIDRSTLPARATEATCVWLLNGIAVATNTSCVYSLPVSAGGKSLSVKVTASAPFFAPVTYSVAPRTIAKTFGELDWVGRINEGALSETVDPGAKLVAKNPTYKLAAPTSFSYQWTRNGGPIPGATAATYTVTSADAGTKIGLNFTAKRAGYGSSTSEAIDVFTVRKAFATRPTPTVTGTSAVGYTLTAKAGTWSPSAAPYGYQWYRNGKAISGATKSTYKATTADGGQKLTVKVTAKKSGYTSASKTSASVTVLKRFTTTPTPTISGTAKAKYTLTAKTGTWAPGTVTKSYQWYRNGKAIAGATKSTYKVSVKDAYTSITVRVTGKKTGYLSVGKTSSAKAPVGIKYANCAALLVDYPGGVATSSSTIDKVRGVPADGILSTTYVSSKLYALNASRDADKDGWACEPN